MIRPRFDDSRRASRVVAVKYRVFYRACLLACGLVSIPGYGQLLEHRTQTDLTTPPPGEPAPSRSEEVDTTGIWYHLKRGDRAAAGAEYRRLQRRHPGWRAPAELLERLAAEALPSAGEAQRLLGWRNLKAGRARPALDAFDRALAAKAGGDSRYGRVRALLALGRVDQAAAEAEKFALTARIAEELHGHYALRALTEAATEPAAALASARRAADYGVAPWLALGWKLLDAGHSKSAIDAFKNAEKAPSVDLGEALHGLVLAYQHSDRAAKAIDVACANTQVDIRLGELCSGLLLDRAGSAAERGNWPTVLTATTRLQNMGLASRDGEMLRAWALYNTGRANEARDLFARLLRQDPGQEIAEALLLAALKAGDKPANIAAYGGEAGNPWLHTVLAQWRADTTYTRALYLASETASPGRHKDLRGIDNAYFAVGTSSRHRRGDAGEGRIDASTLALQGGFTVSDDAWAFGIDNTDFDIGRVSLSKTYQPWLERVRRESNSNSDRVLDLLRNKLDLLQDKLDLTSGMVRSGDSLYEPWLAWRKEGIPFTLSARLGTTPLGGAISARPVGALSLRFDGDSYLSKGRLFAESKRESLLSLAGQEDPYTGRRFGRVVESGGEASLTWFGRERLGVTAGLLGSRLTGKRVENNRHLRLSLSASYDLPLADFEYFRTGPYANWQKYSKNLSHYTTGHGGYYSPQHYLSIGWQLDTLTEEGRSCLFGLRTGLGWTTAREAGGEAYPLGLPNFNLVADNIAKSLGAPLPNGVDWNSLREWVSDNYDPRYAATKNSGVAFNLQLRAGLLLGQAWLLTGLVDFARAPDYREDLLRLELKYTFGGRAAVLRTDLPVLQTYRR